MSTIEIITTIDFILTLTVAGVTAYYIWQQKNIAAKNLKLDLYDRRYKIYKVTNDYILAVLKDATPAFVDDGQLLDYVKWVDFNLQTKETPFLFEADVESYISKVRDNSQALIKAYNVLKDPTNYPKYGAEYSSNLEVFKKIRTWFDDELRTLEKHFEPYLSFRYIK